MRRTITWRFVGAALAALSMLMGTAAADQLDADADADALAAPHGNGVTVTQAEGTTVAYDLSALVKETGNAKDDVFPGTVSVSVSRSGAWLDATPGSPASFSFTAYNSSQSGTIRITVPACTEVGTTETMTAVLTAATSTNGKSLNPNSVTLTYVITAAAGTSSCGGGTTNSAPTVKTAAADANGAEGDTLAASGAFEDVDGDSLSLSADNTEGTFTDNGDGSWSWSLATTDDVAGGTIAVTADDGKGGTVTDQFDYSASNVDPEVSIDQLAKSTTVACGVELDFSWTDPGSDDTHTATVDWGDSAGDEDLGSVTSAVTGVTHAFPGTGVYTVEVTVTDDDGGFDSASRLATFKNTASRILEPIKDGVSNFKIGSSIPVKITVTDCAGTAVTDLRPVVSLVKLDAIPDGTNTDAGTSETATNGKAMAWNGELYHYVLSTKNSQFVPNGGALTPGTYRLTISDPSFESNPTARFDLKK